MCWAWNLQAGVALNAQVSSFPLCFCAIFCHRHKLRQSAFIHHTNTSFACKVQGYYFVNIRSFGSNKWRNLLILLLSMFLVKNSWNFDVESKFTYSKGSSPFLSRTLYLPNFKNNIYPNNFFYVFTSANACNKSRDKISFYTVHIKELWILKWKFLILHFEVIISLFQLWLLSGCYLLQMCCNRSVLPGLG